MRPIRLLGLHLVGFIGHHVELNDRVHCFSMQIVMNKCFLLNPKKNLAQIRLVVFRISSHLIPKSDITEPKARLLYLSVKKLLTCYVSFRLPDNGFRKSETDLLYNWLLSSLAFGSVTSFFGIKSAFFSKTTKRICVKFFSGFKRKHLFITMYIEK